MSYGNNELFCFTFSKISIVVLKDSVLSTMLRLQYEACYKDIRRALYILSINQGPSNRVCIVGLLLGILQQNQPV
jgi:hypothetical protein